jgi:acetyltransferase-like isoleucine patch superfamily enzyme
MRRHLAFARENGLAQLLPRFVTGTLRRVRDGFTASKLRAPGFRAGASPRLLGLSHMSIGREFQAGDGLWLEAVVAYQGQRLSPRLTIGDNVNLSDDVHIACAHRIAIGEGLLAGSRVLISDHGHGGYRGANHSDPAVRPVLRPIVSAGEVVIGRNVWLGDGVAVLAGAEIGDGAVIGVNSVVNGPIPPNTIAVGAPARAVRQWNATSGEWVAVPRGRSE